MRKPDNRSLFEATRPSAAYAPIYDGLSHLREEFHRSGRLDDSNAKLDEVVKLFSTYLAVRLGDIDDFPQPSSSPKNGFVNSLRRCYERAARLPYFTTPEGQSIFGSSPTLVLREEDAPLAAQLTRLVVRAVDDAFRHQELGNPYDVLNEAFGHFVRDNFRGNIEDAQYLTPVEVVEVMSEIAFTDLERSGRLYCPEPVVVADPCCGVGSFLTSFATKYRSFEHSSKPSLRLFGQDKVERMARLTTVNLTLFRLFEHRVSVGNSLHKGSSLDCLNDQVDVILTNPPFGAKFSQGEIAMMASDNTPFFSLLGRTRGPIESELLFVDRNLRLLREGGLLLIVVPDGVVSAGGVSALLRHHLQTSATLRAVIELPAVTFAQAGTRTKTAILYLEKGSRAKSKQRQVFMGVSSDLGFQVNSRKGVQVKVEKGENDLPALLNAYVQSNADPVDDISILSDQPSAVTVPHSYLRDAWTPSHYQAQRLETLRELAADPEVRSTKLNDLVDFVGDDRRVQHHHRGLAFLSVLHVISEGVLDLRSVETYAPKTPGVPVNPGEVLLSRINPRIPRVLVVPDLGKPILCSTEFEVMRAKKDVNPYMVAFLLLSKATQKQIQSLTSGTSASHNRIKTRDLLNVSLPIPLYGSVAHKKLCKLVLQYQKILTALAESQRYLCDLRSSETEWLQTSPRL